MTRKLTREQLIRFAEGLCAGAPEGLIVVVALADQNEDRLLVLGSHNSHADQEFVLSSALAALENDRKVTPNPGRPS